MDHSPPMHICQDIKHLLHEESTCTLPHWSQILANFEEKTSLNFFKFNEDLVVKFSASTSRLFYIPIFTISQNFYNIWVFHSSEYLNLFLNCLNWIFNSIKVLFSHYFESDSFVWIHDASSLINPRCPPITESLKQFVLVVKHGVFLNRILVHAVKLSNYLFYTILINFISYKN